MYAQLAGAVEYTNCFSAESKNPLMSVLIDIKQSNSEARVMLELWGMWSIPSLPLLPGPLWLGVVTPDRVLSVDQIELFDI